MTRQEKIKNLLKLSIQPKVENPTISPNYEIKLNDWTLGRGVTNIELFMPASGKPKLKIECFIDEVDIKDVLLGPKVFRLSKYFKNSKGE